MQKLLCTINKTGNNQIIYRQTMIDLQLLQTSDSLAALDVLIGVWMRSWKVKYIKTLNKGVMWMTEWETWGSALQNLEMEKKNTTNTNIN